MQYCIGLDGRGREQGEGRSEGERGKGKRGGRNAVVAVDVLEYIIFLPTL